MTRYFIELSYKGTAYSGWQIQLNARSVQQTIQEALSTILREPIQIVGAGRTDTGVHASYYIAHFDTDIPRDLSAGDFLYHFNGLLPKDIAINRVYPVAKELHARFSATAREYKYYIHTRKSPFVVDTAMVHTQPLDIDKMQQAADMLLEYNDFTSFAKLHTDTKTNNCNIKVAKFEYKDHSIVFTIVADRFLRNMVRAIVGTLIEVGKGRLSTDDFREIILAKDRCRAKSSAYACGLFLTDIKY